MDKNCDKILEIILYMCIIYSKYLNYVNNTNEQYNKIQIIALEL